MRFVDAITGAATSVIDLGSGGGLPGLVIGGAVRICSSRFSTSSEADDFLRRPCGASSSKREPW